MKKILSFLLIFVTLFCLSSCGGGMSSEELYLSKAILLDDGSTEYILYNYYGDEIGRFQVPAPIKGDKGETGNGISSITKTESNGLVDTYTITFTNGTTTTFTVTNGNNGEDAITPLVKINEETNMWEVSYDNGTTWVSLNVNATGEKGKDADNSTVIATSIASGTSLLSTLSLLIFLLTRKKRII